jgi:hypothetical protein
MSSRGATTLLRHALTRSPQSTKSASWSCLSRRQSSRLLATQASGPASRSTGIQTWQAILLGGLTTVAVQGVVLYASSPSISPPSAADSPTSSTPGGKKLEDAINLIQRAGIETSDAEDVLQGYSTAPGTSYPPSLPLAVVYPSTTEDVVQIVNACRESNVGRS